MRVLALEREEIALLSILHGKPYNSFSIMKRLNKYKSLNEIMSKEEYVKSTNGFVRDGLLGFDPEKKIRPTRETILLFDAINAPQKTFVIQNTLKPQVGSMYYCEKNGFGVLATVSPDEQYCVINYPFNREILGNWLSEEVIGDMEVEKEAFEVESYELSDLDYLHFMVLASYTNFLRNLPEHDSKLSFELEALEDPMYLRTFDAFEFVGIDKEKIGKLFSRNDVSSSLDALIRHGLVIREGERYRIKDSVARVLDANNFRGIVRFSENTPFDRSKTLYATNFGYLIIEIVKYEPLSAKLDILPLTTDDETLIDSVLTFSDLRLSESMRTKLEAKLKPKP